MKDLINLLFRKPSIIFRCNGTSDVVKAITFATKNQVKIAVRAGGGSPAGLSTSDGGCLIDLSLMKSVM